MGIFKKLLFIATGFLTIIYAQAQTATTPDLNKSLIPPSPDAASLGKYGVFPVTLYEGMPNISVPVYEIKSAKLSVPVNLSYNYNGYRPGEDASWIGLGWSLQAGGMITRVVKGMVDDGVNTNYHWQDYANISDMTQNQDFMATLGTRQMDTEPDIYIFNFNGHSGKFIMVGSRAFVFPRQDINITKTGSNFKIVAEDGVSYYFQDTETTTPNNNANPGNYMPAYTSAWYMTRMVSADNTDEIDFQYATWSHRQYNNIIFETYQQQAGGYKNNGPCIGMNSGCDVLVVNQNPGAMIAAKRLTGITSRNTFISFVPEGTQRQDLNSTSAFGLKEVDVYSLPGNTLLKKIQLVHSYFYDGSGIPTELKLSSVNLSGYYVNNTIAGTVASDSIVLPNYYTFQYANENGVFPKSTRGIDKWGYYNGQNGNQMLFDSSFLGYTPLLPGANRAVDSTQNVNGTLTKITYPTGGYTTFDYEMNRIGAPGTHVQEQSSQTSLSVAYNATSGNPTIGWQTFTVNESQTISISYGRDISSYPNGILNNYLILNIYADNGGGIGALLYSSPRLNKSVSSGNSTFNISPGTYHYSVSCESTSASSFVTINYKNILNTPYLGDPGPGLRIRTIRSYDNINNTVPAVTKAYTYTPATLLSAAGYGFSTVLHHYITQGCGSGGTFNENIYTSASSSPLATLIGDQFFYSTVTEVNHDSIGAGKTIYNYVGDGTDALGISLQKQTDYAYLNGNYNLVKQKTNTYTFKNWNNFNAFTYNLSEVVDIMSGCLNPPLNSPNILDTASRYQLYNANQYVLSSNYNQLTATDEINADQTGQNAITTHTDYYYDNNNYLQPSRSVTQNSKGQAVTTQFKYPLDYPITGCGSLYTVDTTFTSGSTSASTAYQLCVQNRYNAAYPYWSPSVPNSQNTQLLNALRSYRCENAYATQYAGVINNMTNGIFNYYSCLDANGRLNSSLTDAQRAITVMQENNVRTTPVEQIESVNKSGSDYLLAANKTDFTVNSSYGVAPKILYNTPLTASTVLKSTFLSNPTSYYQPRVNFKYDSLDNIIEQSKAGDMKTAYIWNYNKMYAIAQAIGGDSANIAYTSFEADNTGNWVVPAGGIVSGGITGAKGYNLTNGSITKSGLDATKTYLISYWLYTGASAAVSGASTPVAVKSKNGWTYYEAKATNAASITVSGSGTIDELRLYPVGTQMTTYSYDPLIGITASCTPVNTILYYEYDPLGRLKDTRNADLNIVKSFNYQYQSLTPALFQNAMQQRVFTRNNCPAGSTGSSITYTVAQGKYSSMISQADADQQAINDINANGQTFANTNGTCSSTSMVSITSNNYAEIAGFAAVFTNTSTGLQYSFAIPAAISLQVLGSIPIGTYNLTISKPGNTVVYGLGLGYPCSVSGTTGASVTVYNVSISSGNCNSVYIDTTY